jgi:WD40 repeat protein
VDVQGLSWTPDGRWLVMWESAAQGHRLLFFTPDGHKYRDWSGPFHLEAGESHNRLAAGVKLVAFSPDSQYLAVGDYGRCIFVLPMTAMTDRMQLRHPLTIEPKDTLQVCSPSLLQRPQ